MPWRSAWPGPRAPRARAGGPAPGPPGRLGAGLGVEPGPGDRLDRDPEPCRQLLDPVQLRRGVLVLGQHDPAHGPPPDREQLEHGPAPLDLVAAELAARPRPAVGRRASTAGCAPLAPTWLLVPARPAWPGVVRAAAHADSISTTARQAMPSARPSVPRPSARVALTETGAPSTARNRSSMAPVWGASRGASATIGAVRVGAGEPVPGRHRVHLGEQGDAVGPLPDGIGVGEVPPQVAQTNGAQHGVGERVAHRVGVAVPPRPRAPSISTPPRTSGRCGSSEKRWTSMPWPMRMFTPGAPPAAARPPRGRRDR